MNHSAFIAFGSNLGHPLEYISSALQCVNEHPKIEIVCKSSIYKTPPWGFDSDNDFYNGVFLINTSLSAGGLLLALQRIEKQTGRTLKSTDNYEDRVIDLDIISYDLMVISTSDLSIPHPLMHVRNFVLEPLSELAPNWYHPLYLKTASELNGRIKSPGAISKIDAL